MNTRILTIAALFLGITGICSAQTNPKTTGGSNAPYVEGPVWTITMIRTKAGMDDDYFKQISGTVKPIYDEEKKQKIILDYKILNGDAEYHEAGPAAAEETIGTGLRLVPTRMVAAPNLAPEG